MPDDTPQRLESVWIQRNSENQYYEQINVSGSDLIVYHDSSGSLTADKISTFASRYLSGSGGGDPAFDGNRPITRSPHQGINVGTSTVVDFLEEFFFPFQIASISINGGTTYYETGSSVNISINGNITANSETIFGSGSIRKEGVDWYTFSSASSYSTTDTGVSSSTFYRTYIEVGNNGSPSLITSSLKTISFIYPYLYGTSSVAGLSETTLYSSLTKLVETNGTKSPSLVGISTYIYFCFPSSYGDLSSIKDPNNFEILNSFEYSGSVPVTSSGLTNNWMETYKVYRLLLQANPNGTFTFYT